MATAEFNYEGEIINIQCNSKESMKEIIKRFTSKIGKSKEDLVFLYGGEIVNPNLIFESQVNKTDKGRNKMSILVTNKIPDDSKDEESLKKSKYIICSECKECSRILVEKYQIGLYGCKNGHKENNISINNFEQTQNYDEAKIKCQNCNKINKSISYNNNFFICLECNINLCQLCKSIHDKNHNIIDYDDRFFICYSHNESFISYCNNCKKDICTICEAEHKEHQIITYGSIFPNINKIKEESNAFNTKKEAFKKEIKDLINKINMVIYTIDNYYEIYQDIINSYGNKKRNYFLLQNIHDMIKFNKNIIQDMNKTIEEKKTSIKINNVINIYDQITFQKKEKNDKDKNDNKLNNLNKMIGEIERQDRIIQEIEKDIKGPEYYEIIEINKQLMSNTEKSVDNYYNNFNLKKLSKILTIKTNIKENGKTFALNDGRIIIYGYKWLSSSCFILDLNKNSQIKLKLDDDEVEDIIQMDDVNVVVTTKKNIYLLEIKKEAFEIIQKQEIDEYYDSIKKLLKLSNKKLAIFVEYDRYNNVRHSLEIFTFENKHLKLIEKKTFESTKKLKIETIFLEDSCVINENIVAIVYLKSGILYGVNREFGFLDIEDDKMIQAFSCSKLYKCFGLINKDLLIFANKGYLYPINLKKYNKKKGVALPTTITDVLSILSLNEKQFLVCHKNGICLYSINKSNEFEMVCDIELNINYISKIPKNRLLIKENDNLIHLYG